MHRGECFYDTLALSALLAYGRDASFLAVAWINNKRALLILRERIAKRHG